MNRGARAGSLWRMRGAAACALIVLAAGCGKLSGVDEYGVAASRDVPYLDGAECRACLASKCAEATQLCDSDDLCSKVLTCRRRCKDPDCHFHCLYDNGVYDKAWADRAIVSVPDGDLYACAVDRCPTECGTGHSWGCVGRYGWSRPADGELDVRHWVSTPLTNLDGGIADAQVNLCSGAQVSCSLASALSNGTTDVGGFVELSTPGFGLQLHMQITKAGYPTYLVFGRPGPRWPRELTASTMQTTAALDATYKIVGRSGYDPKLGYVWAHVWDCSYSGGADGLRLELDEIDPVDGSLHPCDGCLRIYMGDGYKPDLARDRTDGRSPLCVFSFVPPGPAAILARDDSGREVARWQIQVLPGAVDQISLMPLTRDEASTE